MLQLAAQTTPAFNADARCRYGCKDNMCHVRLSQQLETLNATAMQT